VIVLHDDAEREYAYGPATASARWAVPTCSRYRRPSGLPDTKVGTITKELYDEAKKDD
jgi:hypothetical protein